MSALHSTHPMIGFFASAFARRDEGDGLTRFGDFMRTLLAWRNRALMRRNLLAMNDYMLKDIGLSRCDAQREANKPFWEG